MVIAKENKTSDFRQAWIDALRGDIASYAASVRSLMMYQELRDGSTTTASKLEYEKLIHPLYSGALTAQMLIRLRVNPDDPDLILGPANTRLRESVDAIQKTVNEGKFNVARDLLDKLHLDAERLLKHEWKRVKTGEPIYVWAKWVALALTILLAVVLTYFLYRLLLLF